MTKVLIDIDDQALNRASELLGTRTKKDTVNTALKETVKRLDRAVALAEMRDLVTDGGLDLDLLSNRSVHRT